MNDLVKGRTEYGHPLAVDTPQPLPTAPGSQTGSTGSGTVNIPGSAGGGGGSAW